MYTESFDIEFEVKAGKETRYFEFELWVRGMWVTDEADGGEKCQCLNIEDYYFDKELHVAIEINFINKWIDTNYETIRKMFAERIKKYED
jgi:hypothetical protein